VDTAYVAALSALLGAVVGSVLPPALARAAAAKREHLLAARAIRDNFYTYQDLLDYVVNSRTWWPDNAGAPSLLANDDDYRVLAGSLSGDTWKAVSGARRRWARLDFRRGHEDPDVDEARKLHVVLDKARQGLTEKDAKMTYAPHCSIHV
jgi:hypothetical protein